MARYDEAVGFDEAARVGRVAMSPLLRLRTVTVPAVHLHPIGQPAVDLPQCRAQGLDGHFS